MIRRLKKTPTLYIEALKEEWCEKHGYKNIKFDCFFCEWANQHGGIPSPYECDCPANRIDKSFCCIKDEYRYSLKPFQFYAKLKRLNRIRLKRKKL